MTLSGCDTNSYFYGSGKTTAGATNEDRRISCKTHLATLFAFISY